jgi:hypothetical protein
VSALGKSRATGNAAAVEGALLVGLLATGLVLLLGIPRSGCNPRPRNMRADGLSAMVLDLYQSFPYVGMIPTRQLMVTLRHDPGVNPTRCTNTRVKWL